MADIRPNTFRCQMTSHTGQAVSILACILNFLLVIFTHLSRLLKHTDVIDHIIFRVNGGRNQATGHQTYLDSYKGSDRPLKTVTWDFTQAVHGEPVYVSRVG